MHRPEFRREVRAMIPAVEVRLIPGTQRADVIAPLTGHANRGIELGVAAGSFSAAMVRSGRFAQFWGVDVYGDGHGVQEYKSALQTVGLTENYRLLRMTFDQALDLFPDGFFDFIYCDGYAHTGEEGGRTLIQWYAKLKPGGVLAGDDYDIETWPLVVWAVHHVAGQLGVPVQVTEGTSEAAYNRYRSWYLIRPENGPSALARLPALELLADTEKERIAQKRKAQRQARRAQGQR